MKQKHRFRPYTCSSIQRQQRVDFSSFFPAYQYCYLRWLIRAMRKKLSGLIISKFWDTLFRMAGM